jgi:predicted nicotinamide N-methyase
MIGGEGSRQLEIKRILGRRGGRIARVADDSVVSDRVAFVRAHTRLAGVAFVPQIRLYQAAEPIGLWELTEGEYRSEQPPPFWAFAWSGGQALARYVLDHPETVAGLRVLDVASGSGLVAIAAAVAGAAGVVAIDVDPTAIAAIGLNARANAVTVRARVGDILDADLRDAHLRDGDPGDGELGDGELGAVDVVLAGDVFYSKAMAERIFGFLRRAVRARARVLVGDPGRAFLPRAFFDPLRTYDVPVTEALESTTIKLTTVWELRRPATVAPAQR